jgi:hypothetical protein
LIGKLSGNVFLYSIKKTSDVLTCKFDKHGKQRKKAKLLIRLHGHKTTGAPYAR